MIIGRRLQDKKHRGARSCLHAGAAQPTVGPADLQYDAYLGPTAGRHESVQCTTTLRFTKLQLTVMANIKHPTCQSFFISFTQLMKEVRQNFVAHFRAFEVYCRLFNPEMPPRATCCTLAPPEVYLCTARPISYILK